MTTINKQDFVALLEGAGVTHDQMRRFHALFEQRHPEAHEAFLRGLGIAPAEISAIREKSRKS